MSPVWQQILSGAWLTVERARAYSLILLAAATLGFAGWVALSSDGIDRNGKPIGTDFSNVYAAGTLLWQGRPADAYVPSLQHAAERAVFDGRDVPFFGWHYPPLFFAVAAVVAALPYLWGLTLWLVASFAAYLVAIRAILPGPQTLLVASAFPAVFVNLGHGQNGFLSTALLAGALHWLDRKPWLAGALIALLAYKPQFGVLIPLVLLVSMRWRVMASAVLTAGLLVVASVAVLGLDVWHAFADSTAFTRTIVLEQGGTGWEKIQSIFSAFRMWGADIQFAYAAQSALAVMLAASLGWLWRSNAAFDLKAAALATASLLATPYVLDYDLVVLSVGIAFFVRHGLARGFHRGEISLLALVWIMPLLTRSIAGACDIPLGLITMMALYGLLMRRAIRDRQTVTIPRAHIAVA
jgi:alpha-1,2-mannosyltransferase